MCRRTIPTPGVWAKGSTVGMMVRARCSLAWRALEMIDLPPLDEWEEHEDEPGQFHASKSEDGQGCAITDDEFRADPSRGLFCVDYTMSVSAKDVREMMTNG
jgi:hypothetical protein